MRYCQRTHSSPDHSSFDSSEDPFAIHQIPYMPGIDHLGRKYMCQMMTAPVVSRLEVCWGTIEHSTNGHTVMLLTDDCALCMHKAGAAKQASKDEGLDWFGYNKMMMISAYIFVSSFTTVFSGEVGKSYYTFRFRLDFQPLSIDDCDGMVRGVGWGGSPIIPGGSNKI